MSSALGGVGENGLVAQVDRPTDRPCGGRDADAEGVGDLVGALRLTRGSLRYNRRLD